MVKMDYEEKAMKSRRACRLLFHCPLPAGSNSSACYLPAVTSTSILGRNFRTSVASSKSITALSHFSMDSSSETCTCWHRPALHPVAVSTTFRRIFCWSCHQLWWRKSCSRVRPTLLPQPLHPQLLSSSPCPNRFRYMPTGACPVFSW